MEPRGANRVGMQLSIRPEDERRALEILATPKTAAQFADEYWGVEVADDSQGTKSRRGHAFLAPLVRSGKVRRISEGGLDVFVSVRENSFTQPAPIPGEPAPLAVEDGHVVRVTKEVLGPLPSAPAPAQPQPQPLEPYYRWHATRFYPEAFGISLAIMELQALSQDHPQLHTKNEALGRRIAALMAEWVEWCRWAGFPQLVQATSTAAQAAALVAELARVPQPMHTPPAQPWLYQAH